MKPIPIEEPIMSESKGIEKFWELWREFWKEPEEEDRPSFVKWAKGKDSGIMRRAFDVMKKEQYKSQKPRFASVKYHYYQAKDMAWQPTAMATCQMCQEDAGWSWTTFDPMTGLPADARDCSMYVFACKIPCTCHAGRYVCRQRDTDMAQYNPWRRRHHRTRREAELEAWSMRREAGKVEPEGERGSQLSMMMDCYNNTVRFKAKEDIIDLPAWLDKRFPNEAQQAQQGQAAAVQDTPEDAGELELENVGF